MWARLNRWEVPSDTIAEGVNEIRTYLREKAVPEVRQQPGYRGSFSFVDRHTGTGRTISLWDSEDHLRAGVTGPPALNRHPSCAGPSAR